MILRTLLIGFLVSCANSDNIDSLIDDVFGKDPAKETPSNKDKETREVIKENDDCSNCVPYYLCPNGTISTDGTGIIDIRVKESCGAFMDVCCKNPNDANNPIKPNPRERNGCGQRRVDGVAIRIIGDVNNEAQFGEFPWMIALLKKTLFDDGSELMVYQCGGALIHESVVLTAAHCVAKKSDESGELIVRAGEWDSQTTSEIYSHENRKVARVIIHPGFQPGNLWNDFALLVLEKPVKLGDHIDTVCLPSPSEVPLSTECFATGWGKDKFDKKGQYQVILKKIDLPIVPKNQCINELRKTRLGQYFRLHDSFVCAGGVIGKDTCKGDGGSPLVCPIQGKHMTYEVTGLVAWGIGCGNATPGVYAGVAYARNWIDKSMAEIGFPLTSLN